MALCGALLGIYREYLYLIRICTDTYQKVGCRFEHGNLAQLAAFDFAAHVCTLEVDTSRQAKLLPLYFATLPSPITDTSICQELILYAYVQTLLCTPILP